MSKSNCSKVSEKALIIDSFGRPFEFMLPNGSKKYRSLLGSVLTLIIVLVVALYAVYKWQLLIEKDQVTVSFSKEENYFDETSILDPASRFNLAVGIYDRKNRDNLVFDESFGKLSVKMIEYSKSKSGITTTTLTTHDCTAADIALPGETNDNAAFFPLAKEDQGLQLDE